MRAKSCTMGGSRGGANQVWRHGTGSRTPRRPRIIMEGPLVSDTTELLSGAVPAAEDSPIGHSAAGSARETLSPRSMSGRVAVALAPPAAVLARGDDPLAQHAVLAHKSQPRGTRLREPTRLAP